jgi:hypothetical protein
MFTPEGQTEYEKWEKWISDEAFQFSPDFVPTKETPAEAIEYYKSVYKGMLPMIDFDSPDFEWPTGIGLNC